MDVTLLLMSENQYAKPLGLLGEILEKDPSSYVHWLIVCGGAALQTYGIIHRATKDVDIFAQRTEVDHSIDSAYPLSENLKQAVRKVASVLNLPENWLNASTSFLSLSLESYPEYFWQDHKDESYGSKLRVSYLSPRGLITLKTLAVLQRDQPRDTEDLIALAPTESNITEALDWCLIHTLEHQAIAHKITNLLNQLNHGNLINRYQA